MDEGYWGVVETQFERWMARDMRYVIVFLGKQSWEGFSLLWKVLQ